MTFAHTKIQPPRPRAALIERDALQARLAEALTTRCVVLLSAPAGYGKTTLLAQQVARLPPDVAVAWISADAGDDLHRLLECMIAALEPFDPPWRTAPEALAARLAGTPAEDQREIAGEVINALNACDVRHGVMVLDDLHRVDDPTVFRFIDHLIERLGSRWTLVLSSRSDPVLSLARLRASGELAEFRQFQLQFAHDEARRLAHAAGLDDTLADRLFARTHGWPAGLRIAIGAATGGVAATPAVPPERALRASERPMFEYLVSEVLDRLEPRLASFLLRVAVLPELNAERCAVVAGDPNALARLEEIERLGLFVDVLDAPAPTLRLHDLFRDALVRTLEQRDPASLADARRLAVETEPDPMRRITLLLDAGELVQAAALVYAHVPPLVARSGPTSATHLMNRFPAAFRERSPELHFVRGLVAWVHWDFPGMLASFERAEAAFAARGDRDDELLARAFRATGLIPMGRLDDSAALVATLRDPDLPAPARTMRLLAEAWLAVDDGRAHDVAPLVTQMLDLLERLDRLDLWYHTTPANRLPGLPEMTRPLLRHAALLVRLSGDEPSTLRALALLVQAWDALWRGHLVQAGTLAERARGDAAWAGSTGAVSGHLLAFIALREAALGRTAAALDAAELRFRELGVQHSAWGRWLLLLFVARTAAACNDADALRRALGRVEAQRLLAAPTVNPARTRSIVPLEAQLAWQEGRVDDAVSLWRVALSHEAQIEVWGLAAESRVRLAGALIRRGDIAEAADVLSPVFERAGQEGTLGGAVLAADALTELAAVPWRDALPADRQITLQTWSRALQNELRAERHRATGVSSPGTDGVASPADHWRGLTKREREVLARIAAGDSNKLIARALDLSLHTVKRHVANILDKLALDSRGQAAAWYRDRALTPSSS
jgi:LuxR family transcriptional regulator, maltose regulon positive regulatory protein